jgi:hypothetical protein
MTSAPAPITWRKELKARLLRNNNTEPQNSMPVGNKEISALKSVTFIGTAISHADDLQTWSLRKLISV